MSTALFSLTAGLLFALGVYGLLTRPGLLHRLLAVNIIASSLFLFLIVVATGGGHADPVPQAMVLTGLVIALSVTAFALSLARYARVLSQSTDSQGDD